MLILGLDFETTGVDPKKDRVIEAGVVLWDADRKRAMEQHDYIVNPGDITLDAVDWQTLTPIHGISKQDVLKYGVASTDALLVINDMAIRSDAVVAHNGTEFDRLFHQEWNIRQGWTHCRPLWIDTRLDVPEPMTGPLITQCAKKGFLNPFPHQALSDVLSMLRLLSDYDIEKVVERARIPNAWVQADVSFDDKQYAKDRGYFWCPTLNDAKEEALYNGMKNFKLRKAWVKKIKECDVEKEKKEACFEVLHLRQ